MNNKLLNPPVYCPDALATDVGWINPKNGEILVLVKNLRAKIAQSNGGETNLPLTFGEVSATINEVQQPAIKRGRGRPRKQI